MSASLRERRKQLLRDEILLAAQQLLGERGFAALAMDEVAQRVGISKPTLYAHFPTREDLVAAMIAALIDQLFSETLRATEPSASPVEQLSGLLSRAIQVQVDAHAAAYQLWLPEVNELLRRHPASQRAMDAAQQQVLALCRSAIDRGEIVVSRNAEQIARLFSALVSLPFAGGIAVSAQSDVDDLVNFALRVWRSSLRGS